MLLNILESVSPEELSKNIYILYPNKPSVYSIDCCSKLLKTITNLKGNPIPNFQISILENEVCCENSTTNERYSISLSPWEEWIALPVTNSTSLLYSKLDIATHCIVEMTSFGLTPKSIESARDTINNLLSSAENSNTVDSELLEETIRKLSIDILKDTV